MVKSIFGNRITTSKVNQSVEICDLAFVGQSHLLCRVIEVSLEGNVLEPLESVDNIRINQNISYLKQSDLSSIHPILFGNNWDILGNCINSGGEFITINKTLNQNTNYDFIPVVQNNTEVHEGQKIGYTQLESQIKYWILSPTSGIISRITAGNFELNHLIANVNFAGMDFPVFFEAHTLNPTKPEVSNNNANENKTDDFDDSKYNAKSDSKSHSTSDINTVNINQQTQILTGIRPIDLFFPITKASTNSLQNLSRQNISDLKAHINCDIIIHISRFPVDNLSKKEICFVDRFGDSHTTIQNSYSVAYTFALTGIDVVILNQLECKNLLSTNFSPKSILNFDMEYGSITILNINNNQLCGSLNSVTLDKEGYVDISKSRTKHILNNDLILDKGNIQFLSNFQYFHKNSKSKVFQERIQNYTKFDTYSNYQELVNEYNQSQENNQTLDQNIDTNSNF